MLAQRYVSEPLLINGCKFGIRLWLLVTGTDPYTSYLHKQGLVLFSTDRYVGQPLTLASKSFVACTTPAQHWLCLQDYLSV